MPSYRATRVLWELCLETLPQAVLRLVWSDRPAVLRGGAAHHGRLRRSGRSCGLQRAAWGACRVPWSQELASGRANDEGVTPLTQHRQLHIYATLTWLERYRPEDPLRDQLQSGFAPLVAGSLTLSVVNLVKQSGAPLRSSLTRRSAAPPASCGLLRAPKSHLLRLHSCTLASCRLQRRQIACCHSAPQPPAGDSRSGPGQRQQPRAQLTAPRRGRPGRLHRVQSVGLAAGDSRARAASAQCCFRSRRRPWASACTCTSGSSCSSGGGCRCMRCARIASTRGSARCRCGKAG